MIPAVRVFAVAVLVALLGGAAWMAVHRNATVPGGGADGSDAPDAESAARQGRRHAEPDAASVPAEARGESPPPRIHALLGSVRTFDGRALGGAVVRAEPVGVLPGAPDLREAVETTADASGGFEVPKLAAGDWAFVVSAEGALRTFVATVRVPEVASFDLVLPRGSEIEGTVIDETTRAAVGGARVRIGGPRGWIADVTTSRDGRFRFALHDRIHGARIDAPGYARELADSSLEAVDQHLLGVHQVVLVAQRGHTLEGRVVGPDGPIEGAHVEVSASGSRDDPDQVWTATTDPSGRFAIEHLDRDTYWLTAEADGFVAGEDRDPDVAAPEPVLGNYVDPADHGWVADDFVMRRRVPLARCRIAGHVLDGDDNPVPGVTVRTNQRADVVRAVSGADGTFVLENVRAETRESWVELFAERDGKRIGSESAHTVEGACAEDVKMYVDAESSYHGPGRVRGHVTAGGAAVPGALVFAVSYSDEAKCVFGGSHRPSLGSSARTDREGAFDLEVGQDDRLSMAVLAAGFARWRGDFPFDESAEDVKVALVAPVPIAGRAVRAGTDTGISGVDVAVVRRVDADWQWDAWELEPHGSRAVAKTAADGSFRIADFDRENETLRLSGEGWITDEVASEGLAAAAVRVELQPAMDVSGRAEFEGGRPCAGVGVHVLDETDAAPALDEVPEEDDPRPEPVVSIATSADGTFRIASVAPGPVRLEFSGGSPPVLRRIVGPLDAGARDLRVEILPGRTIRGRARLPHGDPAKGVVVRALTSSPEIRAGSVAITDACGDFELVGLDDGEYDVTCGLVGCFRWTRHGVRSDGPPLDVVFDEGLALAGTIVVGSPGTELEFAL